MGLSWIGILGPVELAGEGPVPLSGVKERCLLAALAVHCGKAVSTSGLVDALWADHPPRTAGKTLQNYVLRVRRALARAGGPAIVTPPDGYCLQAAPDVVDAVLAESLIGQARQEMAGGDPAGAAGLLRRALGLWRGPALGELAGRSRPRRPCGWTNCARRRWRICSMPSSRSAATTRWSVVLRPSSLVARCVSGGGAS